MDPLSLKNESKEPLTGTANSVDEQSPDFRWTRFRRYLHRVVHLRAPGLRSVDESDVVQDTLFEACRKEAEGKVPSDQKHFRLWLRRILLCKLIDRIRFAYRKKRDVRREIQNEHDLFGGSRTANLEELADDFSTPSQVFGKKEVAIAVRIAINMLPQQHRIVIRMRFFQGKRIPEIAKITGKTQSAVAGLLYRAMKGLKQELRNQGIASIAT